MSHYQFWRPGRCAAPSWRINVRSPELAELHENAIYTVLGCGRGNPMRSATCGSGRLPSHWRGWPPADHQSLGAKGCGITNIELDSRIARIATAPFHIEQLATKTIISRDQTIQDVHARVMQTFCCVHTDRAILRSPAWRIPVECSMSPAVETPKITCPLACIVALTTCTTMQLVAAAL